MTPWDLFGSPLHYFAKRGGHCLGGRLAIGSSGRSALQHLLTNLQDWSVYVHLNRVSADFRGIKAATRDIVQWRYIVIDLDPVGPLARPLDCALALAEDFNATVVDTGRGAQVLVHLAPTDLDPTNRPLIERGIGRWLRLLKPSEDVVVDTTCSDLARVVRLPGSINQKTGRPAFIVREGALAPQPHYLTSHVMSLGERLPAETVSSLRACVHLARAIPHLNSTAARFVTEGWLTPGRHTAAYATAAALRDAAVPVDRAEAWVVRAGSLCVPPLSSTEALRCVHSAYRKQEA